MKQNHIFNEQRGEALSDYQNTYTSLLVEEIEATPAEHLPALLTMIRLFRESVTLKSAEESFKQGWQEALAGETMAVDELWTGIDAE
jgi:hypothetical protein